MLKMGGSMPRVRKRFAFNVSFKSSAMSPGGLCRPGLVLQS